MLKIAQLIRLAIAEDAARQDITARWLRLGRKAVQGWIVARQPGVFCGAPTAAEVFRQLSANVRWASIKKEGAVFRAHERLATVYGPARAILAGERLALNFLSRLSGVATQTARYVQKVKPYRVQITDTRKTTPLWRELERYAVRMGGGHNHRFNLSDAVLVKDNHWTVLDSRITEAFLNDRPRGARFVEIEADTLAQLIEVLPYRPDIILLDNFSVRDVKHAVKMRNKSAKKKPLLEVSGGITLHNVRRYAATGVERISVGALTQGVPVVDFSLEIDGSV